MSEAGERFLQGAAWPELLRLLTGPWSRGALTVAETLHLPPCGPQYDFLQSAPRHRLPMWRDRDRERMEAPQERATCPQIVLLLLWVVKLMMKYGTCK